MITTRILRHAVLPLLLCLSLFLALVAGCGSYVPGEHDIIDMTKPANPDDPDEPEEHTPHVVLTYFDAAKVGDDIAVAAEHKSTDALTFAATSSSGSDITVTLSQYNTPNMGDSDAYMYISMDEVTETPSGVQADVSLYRLFSDDDPVFLYFYADDENYVALRLYCYSTIKDPFIGYVSADTDEAVTEIDFTKELNQVSYPRTDTFNGGDMTAFYYDYPACTENYSADVTYEIDDNTAQLFGIDKNAFTFTSSRDDRDEGCYFAQNIIDRLKECGAAETDIADKLYDASFKATFTYSGKSSGIVQTFSTVFTFTPGPEEYVNTVISIGNSDASQTYYSYSGPLNSVYIEGSDMPGASNITVMGGGHTFKAGDKYKLIIENYGPVPSVADPHFTAEWWAIPADWSDWLDGDSLIQKIAVVDGQATFTLEKDCLSLVSNIGGNQGQRIDVEFRITLIKL